MNVIFADVESLTHEGCMAKSENQKGYYYY